MAKMGRMAKETIKGKRWAARVAEWRASGLTSTVFCEGRDFNAGGLRNWAYILKRRGAATVAATDEARRSVRMVRVETAKVAATTATTIPAPPKSTATLTIELGAARMVVQAGFDCSTLRTVLEVLAQSGGSVRR